MLYDKDHVHVPKVLNLRKKILAHFYNSKGEGRFGWLRTYVKVKHFFYWERLNNEVKTLVAKYDACQRVKYDLKALIRLLQLLPIPKHIWEDLIMHFVEGLPNSHGFGAILVVVDRLSKEAYFIPLRHPIMISNVVKAFIKNMMKLHEIPRTIMIDRDKIFMSNFWQEPFGLQGNNLKPSSSYLP